MGAANKLLPRYRLAYRSVAHGRVFALCREMSKPTPASQWRGYWPDGGFGQPLRTFAALFVSLMEARHRADYDPSYRPLTIEAADLVKDARQALVQFAAADPIERHRFVSLLVFEAKAN